MKISIVLLLVLTALIVFPASPAAATWIDPRNPGFHSPYRSADPAFFAACPRPRGTVKAFYSYGTHAIAGKPGTVEGADIVFDAGDNNALQCYCPVSGKNGIQTNWLHAANVDSEWKQHALKDGWIEIPDGASWGLASGPYLAKNAEFSCLRPLSP